MPKEREILVALSEIYVPERTVERILRKDRKQIELMIQEYESDHRMIRVVLTQRPGGGYNVQDGRHRVIAAKTAQIGYIWAVIVGADQSDNPSVAIFQSDRLFSA